MPRKINTALIVPLVVGVVIGIAITINLGHQAWAAEDEKAASESTSADNTPRGRTPVVRPPPLSTRCGPSAFTISRAFVGI